MNLLIKENMSSLTFSEFVESVIQELVDTKSTFSAFTVTQAAREKLNAGINILSDRTQEQVFDYSAMTTKIAYFVSHDEVKEIVKSTMKKWVNNGQYDRNPGTYIQYQAVAATPVAATPAPALAAQNTGATHTVKGYNRNGRWVNGYMRSNQKRN